MLRARLRKCIHLFHTWRALLAQSAIRREIHVCGASTARPAPMPWVVLSLLVGTVPPVVEPSRGRFGAFLDLAKASTPSVDPDRAKASALLQRRSLADCEAAVELLERALRRTPDDASLCLECATALNAVMRQRTHSNTLHITRMLDTAESKRVWAQHGTAAQSDP